MSRACKRCARRRDAGVELDRAWNHGKQMVDVEDARSAVDAVTKLARDTDVLFVAGDEALIELWQQQGPTEAL